jgi:hypothetical protein
MVEIHEPPNLKVIDGMSENEDGKNGRRRLTGEREPHQVLAMSDVRTTRSEPRSHRLALR